MLFVINFFTFFFWVIFTMIALISEDAHWAIWIIASWHMPQNTSRDACVPGERGRWLCRMAGDSLGGSWYGALWAHLPPARLCLGLWRCLSHPEACTTYASRCMPAYSTLSQRLWQVLCMDLTASYCPCFLGASGLARCPWTLRSRKRSSSSICRYAPCAN